MRAVRAFTNGLALCAGLFASSAPAHASQTLTTASYQITIDVRCEEGVLGCDQVDFLSVNRKTGKTVRLRGEEIFRLCGDGETPCQFLHYRFDDQDTVYTISDEGVFYVTRGEQVLINEAGDWDYGD